ncbi:hypothetical protein SJ05684_b49850 (plasmid) [Sinorhizobium sojae CCBAU 05684]|uniref:Uncharacterized protein n=1 Tax=Sinorhizobium sojae CCBAU 05684 TaxID=716928 RepID=A0A249PJP7_9HYPH|nr:hypothetical protein SJ05684_b49850 [Sinorhizobium sojae CCBAU 05684]
MREHQKALEQVYARHALWQGPTQQLARPNDGLSVGEK